MNVRHVYQLTVPAQDGVWAHQRGDISEQPTAQAVAERRETSSFVVIEAQPSLEPRLQDAILFTEERDDVRLLALQPPAEHRHDKVKRKHGRSLCQRPDPAWDTTR